MLFWCRTNSVGGGSWPRFKKLVSCWMVWPLRACIKYNFQHVGWQKMLLLMQISRNLKQIQSNTGNHTLYSHFAAPILRILGSLRFAIWRFHVTSWGLGKETSSHRKPKNFLKSEYYSWDEMNETTKLQNGSFLKGSKQIWKKTYPQVEVKQGWLFSSFCQVDMQRKFQLRRGSFTKGGA